MRHQTHPDGAGACPAAVAAAATGFALLAIFVAGSAAAASPTCRDWQEQHRAWKARVIALYLDGSPTRELDAALFELMQREAWLTACDVSVEGARAELVGWRLVDRSPEEYGAGVLESVLERAGLDLDLRPLFADGWLRETRRVSAEPVPGRASH